jgi:hypothetical protein
MSERRLAAIERKLDGIQETLNEVAVQNEQIATLQGETRTLFGKWDDFTRPGGELNRMIRHQASCPRGQIRYLWCIVIPMGLTLLGVGFAVIKIAL